LVFFLLSFGFRVGKLEGRFFFQVVCGVESRLSNVQLSMQVLLGGDRGEGGGFIFLLANRIFFFSFPSFLMCSHGVPSKFLMGS
jgi:hypothetical protein